MLCLLSCITQAVHRSSDSLSLQGSVHRLNDHYLNRAQVHDYSSINSRWTPYDILEHKRSVLDSYYVLSLKKGLRSAAQGIVGGNFAWWAPPLHDRYFSVLCMHCHTSWPVPSLAGCMYQISRVERPGTWNRLSVNMNTPSSWRLHALLRSSYEVRRWDGHSKLAVVVVQCRALNKSQVRSQ